MLIILFFIGDRGEDDLLGLSQAVGNAYCVAVVKQARLIGRPPQ